MHCTHCGSSLPDGATQCPSCDRRIDDGLIEIGSASEADERASQEADLTELSGRLQDALGAKYRVEQPIGQGGFAIVFLVRDLTLKRALAVKVISPDLIISNSVVERFHREAETIAQLSHAHIVPVHFVGQQADLFYLAMEYIEGESLADRLAREGQLTVDEVARILREIASALDLAHRRGVIHRDIKPHNVLLERETGRALLSDFGIARTAEGASLTASGMVVGSPIYMSPEQVTGDKVDYHSDIYSLGLVAYEMLAGEPPFTGTTEAVMFRRITQPPDPIEQVRPDVPPDLARIISRCVAPAPDDRFASAGEIVRELGAVTPVSGTSAASRLRVQRRVRRGLAAAVFGSLLASVAGALWLLRIAGAGSGDAARPSARAPTGMVLVPGGTYFIGRDDGHQFARPAHRVVLAPFAIDSIEVTVGDYARFAAETGTPLPWDAQPDSALPVTRVTWFEAGAYCAWRHDGGRLPAEEEWEAAARGRDGFRYPWGDGWIPGAANTQSLGNDGPVPALSLAGGESAVGAVDLIGNVWEWTGSRMTAYPGGTAPEGSERYYVIRGGAFDTPDSLADATYRGYLPPSPQVRSDFRATGFRCAVSVPGG